MRALALAPSWYVDALPAEPVQPPLTGRVHADVAVLGGGITGLSAALELAGRGYRVALVEAARIGAGGSGRSGGQVLADYACGMDVLVREFGRDGARALWDWSLEAVARVRTNIARYGIDCDWRDGCATLAIKPRHERMLRAWQETLERDYGYAATRWYGPDTLGGLVASQRYRGALLDTGAGHLQPLAYTRGLARAARAAGVAVYEDSPMTRLDRGPRPVLHTPQGALEAGQLVVAGGALPARLVPELAAKVLPVGTYIVATEPLGAGLAARLLPADAALCDANFVLDYFRRSADHRLLFGGRVSYSGLESPGLAAGMRRRMLAVFPQLPRTVAITHAWGGHVDITVNRAPHFGRIGTSIWYAQGFSGHGMALANLAGAVLAEAVAGQCERCDVYARIAHRPFPGGERLRVPLLMLAMLGFRLRDWL